MELNRLKLNHNNLINPGKFCSMLGECELSLSGPELEAYWIVQNYVWEHPFIHTEASSSTCQICQWIFSAYESWLSDGETQNQISLFLSQLCNFFGSYSKQCAQLISVYIPKVIQSYIENTTPPFACSSIGVCHL